MGLDHLRFECGGSVQTGTFFWGWCCVCKNFVGTKHDGVWPADMHFLEHGVFQYICNPDIALALFRMMFDERLAQMIFFIFLNQISAMLLNQGIYRMRDCGGFPNLSRKHQICCIGGNVDHCQSI